MTGDALGPVEPIDNEITVIDDDALSIWLKNEELVILPEAFFAELMTLMETHVMVAVGIDRERMNELTVMLELAIGEEGMTEISMEEFINWLRVLDGM